MKQRMKRFAAMMVMTILLVGAAMPALASDDNSLQGLGISTPGVTVTPEFAYDTWTYDVTVPAGTTTLELSPQPSSSVATISSVTGTTLNPDGTGTVYITVQAQSGAEFTYTLNVTSSGEAAAAAPTQTEAPAPPATEAPPQTEPPTEPQTEDSRFVRVDKNTIQEAENTITNLKGEISSYRDTINLYTRIMYGLIGLAVILLFVIINLILRKRDLKAELNDYRRMGYGSGKKGGKKSKAQGGEMPAAQQEDPRAYQQPGRAPAQPAASAYRRDAARIEVTPQVSSRKNRKLPEYQEEPAVEVTLDNNQSQPQAPKAPEVKAPEAQPAGKDVEINMIDL